ncbi:MAG: NAD(P)/FAD-dependent oxidoreductase [Myxococcota bacterium]
MSHVFDVIVIGAGATGVGVGASLRHAEIENFIVLERHTVGASFRAWPVETRFITPSFPTNSIGMLDLNSIAIGVSPAFALQEEHPTGTQYAAHLAGVAQLFQLPVRERTDVEGIEKVDNLFRVHTNNDTLLTKHVIWAAGEFQYPNLNGFSGSELCRHTATIASYGELEGDDFIVIGGYESGIDAAYHLALRGKKVRLLDRGCPWESKTSDPSVALSTYSLERMRQLWFTRHVQLSPFNPVVSVDRVEDRYEVQTLDGRRSYTPVKPLLAGGFDGSHKLIEDLFDRRADGFPLLSEHDESTIVPGIFLCGPAVRHDDQSFCFIYKYRQRFGVVAKAIATSLGMPTEELESYYRMWGMFLDDLSCCGEECVC